MDIPGHSEYEVKGSGTALLIAARLIEASKFFTLMPLPSDHWMFTVKDEAGVKPIFAGHEWNSLVVEMLVVSTGHIPKSDDDLLRDLVSRDALLIGHVCTDAGWLLHVDQDGECHEAQITHMREAGLSGHLIKLVEHAHKLGCWWLNLDRDGEPLEDFEQFTW